MGDIRDRDLISRGERVDVDAGVEELEEFGCTPAAFREHFGEIGVTGKVQEGTLIPVLGNWTGDEGKVGVGEEECASPIL